MSPRSFSSLRLLVLALSLAWVPACSSPPECVIDTDCPLGQYCTNTPGGSGGSCVDLGAHDAGGRTDAGATDGGARDAGDTGPAVDAGPRPDGGASDAGAVDGGPRGDTGTGADAGV